MTFPVKNRKKYCLAKRIYFFYVSVMDGLVFHFPLVKSGKSTALPLFATEASVIGEIALLVTES
jgi:hypothetical protein